MTITGFDPLCSYNHEEYKDKPKITDIFDRAIKSTINNILKSYTGFYDVFNEPIQNAMDATQKKCNVDSNYSPKIWIKVDIKEKIIRVVDNGVGMDEEEFLYCFRPNVSFKKDENLRGNKGVGATFIAYGFNYVGIYSKKNNATYSALFKLGRLWAEDKSGKKPRPTLEQTDFEVKELVDENSGTCIEIQLTGQGNEKPKDLGWHGATTAKQWLDILRIVTPLGGMYLKTPPFKPNIYLEVIDRSGTKTEAQGIAEYYYPHEIPSLKVYSLNDIVDEFRKIDGDPKTQWQKLPEKIKNLDCIYEIWDHNDICDSNSLFFNLLTREQREMVEYYQVSVYLAHMDSAKTFESFNKQLNLRENAYIFKGGLQLASDYMPQGDFIIIPLKRYIGYQRNTHVIVHFMQGSPDLGRKTFQPELKELAEQLSLIVTNHIIKYRWLLKPDTGSTKPLSPDNELYQWRKRQDEWRNKSPFSLSVDNFSYISLPKEEQDVIAIFNQLIGAGVIKGIDIFSTEYNEKYDSLYELNYSNESYLYSIPSNQLGIRNDIDLPYSSAPKVLEYKYDLDSLIEDFDKEIKFCEHVDLVVCWKASGKYSNKLMLKSLLLEDEGNVRINYGSTHNAFYLGQQQSPVFEVVILEDLCNYISDPDKEISHQKNVYQ